MFNLHGSIHTGEICPWSKLLKTRTLLFLCFDTRYNYDLAIHDEQTTSLWKFCNKIYFLVYSNWWWEFAAHSIWLPTILSLVVVLFMSNILMDHIVQMHQIIFNAYTIACYMTSVLQHGLLLICATTPFSSYDNKGSLTN